MKVRTQGQVVEMVVILVEEEKMWEMLVVVPWVVVMFFGYDIRGGCGVSRSPSPALPKGRESILAVS